MKTNEKEEIVESIEENQNIENIQKKEVLDEDPKK